MAVVSNGTTIIDAGALGSGVATGKMILIKTLTASGSANLSFVDGASSVVLDNTYDSYVFKIINAHPGTDDVNFTFNFSTDGGSNYNATKTTTVFNAYHKEDDSEAALAYNPYDDLAQSTAYQSLSSFGQMGIDNDQSLCSTIYLYNPSSTVFVKHFIATTQFYQREDRSNNVFTAGYANTTSAIDAVQFKMASGNIDSGVIKMYGIGG
jgi:hypothetical protein